MFNPGGYGRTRRRKGAALIGAFAVCCGTLPLAVTVATPSSAQVESPGTLGGSTYATSAESIVSIPGAAGSKVKGTTKLVLTLAKAAKYSVTAPDGSVKVAASKKLAGPWKSLGAKPRGVLVGTKTSGASVSVPVSFGKLSVKKSTVSVAATPLTSKIPSEFTDSVPGISSVGKNSAAGSYRALSVIAQKSSAKTWQIAGTGAKANVADGSKASISVPTPQRGVGTSSGGVAVSVSWDRLADGADELAKGAQPRVVVTGVSAKGKPLTFSATPDSFGYQSGSLEVLATGVSPKSALKGLDRAKSLSVLADVSNPADTRTYMVITGDGYQAGTGGRYSGSIHTAPINPDIVDQLSFQRNLGDNGASLAGWLAGSCVLDRACTGIDWIDPEPATKATKNGFVYARAPKQLKPAGALLPPFIEEGQGWPGTIGCTTTCFNQPTPAAERKYQSLPVLNYGYDQHVVYEQGSIQDRCFRSKEAPGQILAKSIGQSDLAVINLACAGASLADVKGGQISALKTISNLVDVSLVTNSMGGEPLLSTDLRECFWNTMSVEDGPFSSLYSDSYSRDDNFLPKGNLAAFGAAAKLSEKSSACVNGSWKSQMDKKLAEVKEAMPAAIAALRSAAPNAKVLAVNYPNILAHPAGKIFDRMTEEQWTSVARTGIGPATNGDFWTRDDALYISQTLIPGLNKTIWDAAKKAEVIAVDQTELFNGRENTTNAVLHASTEMRSGEVAKPFSWMSSAEATNAPTSGQLRFALIGDVKNGLVDGVKTPRSSLVPGVLGAQSVCLSNSAKTRLMALASATWNENASIASLGNPAENSKKGSCGVDRAVAQRPWFAPNQSCTNNCDLMEPPKMEEQRTEFVNAVVLGSGIPKLCPGGAQIAGNGAMTPNSYGVIAYNGHLTLRDEDVPLSSSGDSPDTSPGGDINVMYPRSFANVAYPKCLGAVGPVTEVNGKQTRKPGPEALMPNYAGQLAMGQCWIEVLKADKSQACVRSIGDNEFVRAADANFTSRLVSTTSCSQGKCNVVVKPVNPKYGFWNNIQGEDSLCLKDEPRTPTPGADDEWSPTTCQSEVPGSPSWYEGWQEVYDTEVEFDPDLVGETPDHEWTGSHNRTKRMQ